VYYDNRKVRNIPKSERIGMYDAYGVLHLATYCEDKDIFAYDDTNNNMKPNDVERFRKIYGTTN